MLSLKAPNNEHKAERGLGDLRPVSVPFPNLKPLLLSTRPPGLRLTGLDTYLQTIPTINSSRKKLRTMN